MRLRFLRILPILLLAVCILPVTALADGDAVWQSGTGETCATISEAIRNNPLYGTITLLQDAAGEMITVPENERLTIDLGGHTYTVTEPEPDPSAVLIGDGSVAILKNGTLCASAEELPAFIWSCGRLTVDGVTLSAEENFVADAAVYALSGTVTIRGDTRILSWNCNVAVEAEAEATIEGGYFCGSVAESGILLRGGRFECFDGLIPADGYTLEEESGCIVPLGGSCAEHACGAWEPVDDDTHTRTCTQCDFTETAPHSYGAPVFDWSGGSGGIHASCRLRCRDCGDTIVISVPDASVTVRSETEGETLYEAACSFPNGDAVRTYRSYLEVRNSYSVTLDGEGGSYPYGATATLSAPDPTAYYDFYENGIPVAQRATAIEVTVTGDRHFTAVPHSDRETAADTAEAPLVRVSTPQKRGNKWNVTLLWAIPDIDPGGTSGSGASEADEPAAAGSAPRLVEAGIYYLYAYAPGAPDPETLIRDGKQVVAPLDGDGSLSGSFALTSEVSAGNAKTMYALGYVIYESGDTGKTVYADTVAVGTAANPD